MKKEECCSVFMTTLMVAIPVGAVFALIFDIFGFISIQQGKTAYVVLQDHGSLLGAIVGAIVLAVTVFITLNNQTKNIERQMKFQDEQTRLQIDAQQKQVEDQIKASRESAKNDKLFYLFGQASALLVELSEIARMALPLELEKADLNIFYNSNVKKSNMLISLNKQLKIDSLRGEIDDYAKVLMMLFMVRGCQSGIITVNHCRAELNKDIQSYISQETKDIIMQCRKLMQSDSPIDFFKSCELLYKRQRHLNKSIASLVDMKMTEFYQ